MIPAQYEASASKAIQALYDAGHLSTLADRVEEVLHLLDQDPADVLLRRHRMHQPKLWRVTIYGNDEAFTFLWDFEGNVPWVRWAGFGTI